MSKADEADKKLSTRDRCPARMRRQRSYIEDVEHGLEDTRWRSMFFVNRSYGRALAVNCAQRSPITP